LFSQQKELGNVRFSNVNSTNFSSFWGNFLYHKMDRGNPVENIENVSIKFSSTLVEFGDLDLKGLVSQADLL
jgi:hypothetical protein